MKSYPSTKNYFQIIDTVNGIQITGLEDPMKALLKCARKLKDNEFHSTLEKKSVDQSKSKNGDLSIASDKNSASESAVTNIGEKENRVSTISNFGDRENRPSTMSINAGNRQYIFFHLSDICCL